MSILFVLGVSSSWSGDFDSEACEWWSGVAECGGGYGDYLWGDAEWGEVKLQTSKKTR